MNDPANSPQKTAALTGATGFIGRYLIDALRADGWQVKALTRRRQNPEPSVEWVAGDLADQTALAQLTERCDAVIHAAGATKALNRNAFHAVNTEGIERILSAIGSQTPRFLLISSLAAREPQISDYAASKSAGEETLKKQAGAVPWIIMRPPAVYGPGDVEIVKLLKVMKMGFALSPGHPGSRFSLIHARDAAAAAIALISAPTADGALFEIDDGRSSGYTMADISSLAADLMGRKIRTLRMPKAFLSAIGAANEGVANLIRAPVMLTRGKARELVHPDWVSNPDLKPDPAVWKPRIGLRAGLGETIQWGRERGIF